jgi:N,N-dimethylformamidase beta subunit-like protein/carbohydrate binding protein with CBM6 domain/Big-like domain-containing protein
MGIRTCLVSIVVLVFIGRAADGLANSIQTENAKPGTSEWKITRPGYASGTIEGYASLTSVNRGGRINLFVNTTEPSYTMDFFRIGYYGGLGSRRMLPTITRTGTVQPTCPMDSFGMVECDWTNPYVLTVPNSSDPTDWMSGVYVVKLTASVSGKQQYIIFVVRDDTRASDLLMAQTVNTYHAYNPWGGKSLYGTIANRTDTANKAMKVSFDRPYYGAESYGAGQFFGSGLTLGREQGMVQWLEREGYDVTYATNVDVDNNPTLLWNHKAFLSVGHDEYWSWQMRDNVEAARDRGVNLGFFSGNTSYWQVRYEPSVANNAPSRVIVGYKEFVQQDPITPDYLKTTLFRNAPVNRSEDAMIGVRYITQANPPLCVEDGSHWVFTGTGLRNGDCLLNSDGTPFLGYEVDAMGPFSPANTQRLAHSPATARYATFSDMTTYRAASGATVFSTGSINWSTVVPQVQQITRNVLARFISGAFADTTPIRPLPPVPFQTKDIGSPGRPGFVALAGNSSFTLNGAGGSADAMFVVYQRLAGDGEVTTRLISLENFWNNRAGVFIRDSLDATSKAVLLLARPTGSSGAVNEGADMKARATAGGSLTKIAALDQKQPNWIRLARNGDTFTASLSPDGVAWTVVGTTTVSMAADAYVGIAVQSGQRTVWATARFDNVSVTTGPPSSGDTTKPTVSIASPVNGTSVSSTVTVSATAADNVAVAGVQFKIDGSNLGAEDTSSPYNVSWDTTGVANGNHTVTAVARDSSGNTATSSISVDVSNPASGGGSGMTIEAERFDDGAEGVAYHDTTAGNTGGAFRNTDVDIQATTDTGGGYNVGWTRAGEWLNYTVNVPAAGTYTLDVRVASNGAGGTFHFNVNGVDRTGPLVVPNTAGWQTWKLVTKSGISLAAGTQVLRLVMDANGPSGGIGNFNWFRLTPTAPASGGTPFNGTPAVVPGTIEAERFDEGGEGVAYHDVTAGNSGSAFRTTDVDIQATTDTGGGYNVGWTKAGEWLNYTVNVATARTYTLELRVASNGAGGTVHLTVNGVDATGPVVIPNTGGWQTWTLVTKSGISLSAGTRVLRLVMDANGATGSVGNFNWIGLR